MTQPRRKKVPGYVARELELATPQIGVIIADAEAARA